MQAFRAARLASFRFIVVVLAALALGAEPTTRDEPATAPSTTGPTTRDDAGASDAARAFLRAVATGDTKTAADMVDAQALAVWIYGGDLSLNRPAHLAEAYPKLAWSVAAFHCEVASLRRLFTKTGEPQVTPILDNVVEVKVPCTSADGQSGALILTLRQELKWKLIDIGLSDQRFSTRERADYEAVKSRMAPAAHMLQRAQALAVFIDGEKRREAPPPRYATSQFRTAEDAGWSYVEMCKTNRLTDALDIFWDTDQLLRLSFGQAYDQMSPADRNQALWVMRDYLRPTMASKKIRDLMAKGKWSPVETTPRRDGTVVVKVYIALDKLQTAQSLNFYKSRDGWKIYDSALASGSIVDELRRGFGETKGQMSPLDFVLEMKKESDAMVEKEGG